MHSSPSVKFHFPIKWKLGILLGSFVVVFGIIIFLNYRTTDKVTRWLQRIDMQLFPQFAASQYLLVSFDRLSSLLDDIILSYEPALVERAEAEKMEFLVHLDSLSNYTLDRDQPILDSLKQNFLSYYEASSELASKMGQKNGNSSIHESTRIRFSEPEYIRTKRIQQGLKRDITKLVMDRDFLVKQSLSMTASNVQRLLKRSLLIGVLAFILMLSFVIYLSARIVRPLILLSDTTTEIAKGNFDSPLSTASFAQDEIGQLASSFQSMVEGLKETTVSKDYVNNIIHSMADALIVMSPERKIQMVNRAAIDLLGYNQSDLIDKPMSTVCIDLVSRNESYGELMELGYLRNREGKYRTRSGKLIPVSFSAAVMQNGAGQAVGIVCVAKDISERIQMENMLRNAKEVAEAANHAKSEFLARMSHELRTPLNSVIGFTNVLMKNKSHNLTEREITYLSRIAHNGTHLLNLINNLLDITRIESGRIDLIISTFDVGNLITETVEQLSGQIQNDQVSLVMEVPEDVHPLTTDRGRLKQVLINLIGNAIKFTDSGHIVTRLIVDEKSRLPLRIEVEDSGIGIPADRLVAIFDAFQQVDNSLTRKYGGTGLGLAISKSICTLLKFKLSVTSILGQGSVFSIVFQKDSMYSRTLQTDQSERIQI